MIWRREKGPQFTFEVEGMRCGNCESNVKIALRKILGVRKVKIIKRRQVIVDLQPNKPISKTDLITAIENAGYVVAG